MPIKLFHNIIHINSDIKNPPGRLFSSPYPHQSTSNFVFFHPHDTSNAYGVQLSAVVDIRRFIHFYILVDSLDECI